eukprot:gene16441-biopygen11303
MGRLLWRQHHRCPSHPNAEVGDGGVQRATPAACALGWWSRASHLPPLFPPQGRGGGEHADATAAAGGGGDGARGRIPPRLDGVQTQHPDLLCLPRPRDSAGAQRKMGKACAGAVPPLPDSRPSLMVPLSPRADRELIRESGSPGRNSPRTHPGRVSDASHAIGFEETDASSAVSPSGRRRAAQRGAAVQSGGGCRLRQETGAGEKDKRLFAGWEWAGLRSRGATAAGAGHPATAHARTPRVAGSPPRVGGGGRALSENALDNERAHPFVPLTLLIKMHPPSGGGQSICMTSPRPAPSPFTHAGIPRWAGPVLQNGSASDVSLARARAHVGAVPDSAVVPTIYPGPPPEAAPLCSSGAREANLTHCDPRGEDANPGRRTRPRPARTRRTGPRPARTRRTRPRPARTRRTRPRPARTRRTRPRLFFLG